MFITSHHTLDKLDSTLREMLAAKAELLGAIRLPNDCLQEKCRHGSHHRHRDAPQAARRRIAARPGVEDRRGFCQRPEGKISRSTNTSPRIPHMMLGTMRLARGMYRRRRADAGAGRPGFGRGAGAGGRAACRKTSTRLKISSRRARTFDLTIPAPDYIKPNAYCVHEDGRVCHP